MFYWRKFKIFEINLRISCPGLEIMNKLNKIEFSLEPNVIGKCGINLWWWIDCVRNSVTIITNQNWFFNKNLEWGWYLAIAHANPFSIFQAIVKTWLSDDLQRWRWIHFIYWTNDQVFETIIRLRRVRSLLPVLFDQSI